MIAMTKKKHKYSNKKLSRGEPPNFSGQHLMHNKKLLQEIVDQAKVSKKDTVLELGAGKGALTTFLSERAKRVLAVEYDQTFIQVLNRKMAHAANTTIIHEDIMRIHLPKGEFVVVSNIPYSITTPIMKKLLSNPVSGFQRGVIVMEKGAAKRFTSPFIKNAYVLAWRMWFDLEYVKGISRECFSPPPKVDSAMVFISRKPDPIVPYKDRSAFFGLAEYALREPKAPADSLLRGIFTATQLKHVKRNAGIKHDVSIGALSERQWGVIFETMTQYVRRPLWPRPRKTTL